MKPQTPEHAAERIASAPEHYRGMINHEAPRFAVVRGARTVREAEAYLPSNYQLMESFEEEDGPRKPRLIVIIGGYDSHGWTLDSYVIPRYGSGSIACEEIG